MSEGIIFLQQASIHHLFIYSFILTINQSINKLSNFIFFIHPSTHSFVYLFSFFHSFFCLLNINLPVRPSVCAFASSFAHSFIRFLWFFRLFFSPLFFLVSSTFILPAHSSVYSSIISFARRFFVRFLIYSCFLLFVCLSSLLPFIHYSSIVCAFVRSFVCLFLCWFVFLSTFFVCSFVHSFTHSYVSSFIRSFVRS